MAAAAAEFTPPHAARHFSQTAPANQPPRPALPSPANQPRPTSVSHPRPASRQSVSQSPRGGGGQGSALTPESGTARRPVPSLPRRAVRGAGGGSLSRSAPPRAAAGSPQRGARPSRPGRRQHGKFWRRRGGGRPGPVARPPALRERVAPGASPPASPPGSAGRGCAPSARTGGPAGACVRDSPPRPRRAEAGRLSAAAPLSLGTCSAGRRRCRSSGRAPAAAAAAPSPGRRSDSVPAPSAPLHARAPRLPSGAESGRRAASPRVRSRAGLGSFPQVPQRLREGRSLEQCGGRVPCGERRALGGYGGDPSCCREREITPTGSSFSGAAGCGLAKCLGRCSPLTKGRRSCVRRGRTASRGGGGAGTVQQG